MDHIFRGIFLIQLLCAGGTALQSPPTAKPQLRNDYVLVDFRDVPLSFMNYSYNGLTNHTSRNYTAFVAVLPSNINNNFSFELPHGGCGNLGNTSQTASLRDCIYATNAGYFGEVDESCVGNLIINSTIQQVTGTSRVNFALTNTSYVVGYLTNDTVMGGRFNWSQLISGAGWLVRSGIVYINDSAGIEQLPKRFVTEKAPRTGICAARNGTLIIVEVDGQEDISAGLDLYEFSEVLQELGCWQAVNLDGGGSSTSVYNGIVINKPTCHDTSEICERKVSSITCIRT